MAVEVAHDARRLKDNGARLDSSEVEKVSSLLGEDCAFMDLSADSDDELEGEEVVDGRDIQGASPMAHRGYYVKNFMERVMVPELLQLEAAYPGIIERYAEEGLDRVVSADGTAVTRWSGRSEKLEIGAVKIVVPLKFTGTDLGAQQAACWALPILMHTGAHCILHSVLCILYSAFCSHVWSRKVLHLASCCAQWLTRLHQQQSTSPCLGVYRP